MVHNTVVMNRKNASFLSVPSGAVTVKLTANLFSGVGRPTLMAGGFPSGAIMQKYNLVTTSGVAGSDFINGPVFWPGTALMPQITLTVVPDPTYLKDSPAPFVLRTLPAGTRYIGALQATASW